MLYPVYPERHLQRAMKLRRIRKAFPILAGVSALMFVTAWPKVLGLAGFCLVFIFSMLYLAVGPACDVMMWVRIHEQGVQIQDEKGEVLRSTEYRHIRNIEIRRIAITDYPREGTKENRFSFEDDLIPAREVSLIMVYFDGADCFEDLKLQRIGRANSEKYWCDEVLFHHNCIALVYNEGAWKQLQKYCAPYKQSLIDGHGQL